ncbi:DUF2577 family protein [Paenibacillus agricola]|uniref:DUF2577 family protein n=1 Tax=Paenibacillus agricola TaxID=2716264 RepID=A0ABX0J4A4_9BACL|nr:DUF2577 family protein [Paenibacillus agricola]NHN31124.1 DUF2577 family protein [Paenibacillus agricola]
MASEGSGYQKLANVIKKRGFNEFDKLEFATVISLIPTLIKVDGMTENLDAYDLVFAESLTDHTRTVTIAGGVETEMLVKSPLIVGDRVIVSSMNEGQTYFVIEKAVMI